MHDLSPCQSRGPDAAIGHNRASSCNASDDALSHDVAAVALTAGSRCRRRGALARRSQRRPAAGRRPQTPTFKAQVDYVEVDALVTDQQGRFVRDLTKDDFQVFEDGKPQTISTFSLVDIPVERADRPLFAADADRARRQEQRAAVRRPRLRDGPRRPAHRRPAVAARARAPRGSSSSGNLGANDLMAVVHTGGRDATRQEFTSNKRLLLAAVDKFIGQKLDSATLTRNDEYYRQRDARQRGDEPRRRSRRSGARASTRGRRSTTLKSVADWFGGVRGRRKTMLLSAKASTTTSPTSFAATAPSDQARRCIDDMREAIAAAARSNVSIYAIDPRGLTTLGDDTIGVDSVRRRRQSVARHRHRLAQQRAAAVAGQPAAARRRDRRLRGRQPQRLRRRRSSASSSDNSSYYVLAYYPPSDKRDGKFHKIEVRVDAARADASARAAGTRRRAARRRRRRSRRPARPSRRSCSRRSTARCRSAA